MAVLFFDYDTAMGSVYLLKLAFRNQVVLTEGQLMIASKIQLFCPLFLTSFYLNLVKEQKLQIL